MKMNSIRRYVAIYGIILISSILSCTLSAQSGNSDDILRKMSSAIEEMGAIALEFNLKPGPGTESMFGEAGYSGIAEAQGNSFKMVSPDFEIFCDGESKWFLSVDSDELAIFPNDTNQTDIFENPIGFLKSLISGKSSGYKYSQRALQSADGKSWNVELAPSGKNSLCKNMIISIGKSDYLPSAVVYSGTDGSNYKIEISSLKRVTEWSDKNFVFPDGRMKGLQVTDLR